VPDILKLHKKQVEGSIVVVAVEEGEVVEHKTSGL
jgi:hypothetical protein